MFFSKFRSKEEGKKREENTERLNEGNTAVSPHPRILGSKLDYA